MGLGGWGLGGGGGGGLERGRNVRNQFREGIRRGVLKKVEEQSSFSLLHSATNIMDMWLRPPYSTHVRGNSKDSDSKTPLLGNVDDQGRDIHDVPLTFPELENQLRNELNWLERQFLAEQAKGASGEIKKLVGAVVKDVKAREGAREFCNSSTNLPNPTTFELTPTTANQTENQSPRSSVRVDLTDTQIQEQIQAQMDREAEREAEREMEREMQAQMDREAEREAEREMEREMQAQMGTRNSRANLKRK
ncbi:hypothetical protein DID88_006948 [Monilinia fructigena]|uniref:Uncharacterized protein n=1 Tax=Monilinia fructigena TaxID=38457 RepID=A0A395IIR1_9HELO|nr:hypothetical protein DID88_006948 [Monilinia fructigena]